MTRINAWLYRAANWINDRSGRYMVNHAPEPMPLTLAVSVWESRLDHDGPPVLTLHPDQTEECRNLITAFPGFGERLLRMAAESLKYEVIIPGTVYTFYLRIT